MKFAYGSDLHLEFQLPDGYKHVSEAEMDSLWMPEASQEHSETVLALAGDIWAGFDWSIRWNQQPSWIERVASRFRHVFILPGNHDYWGCYLEEPDFFCEKVTYLQNVSHVIDGIEFVGATLWTDYNKGSPLVEYEIHQWMNDFRFINTEEFGALTPRDLKALNNESTRFLLQRFADRKAEKQVCITHHAPFVESNDGYRKDELIYAYCNTRFYAAPVLPDLWVHGHIHKQIDYEMDTCRVVANPRGYKDRHSFQLKYLEL